LIRPQAVANGGKMAFDWSAKRAARTLYVHRDGIAYRKMEWSRMFTWNPAYSLVYRELSSSEGGKLQDIDVRITVDVVMTSVSTAFPPHALGIGLAILLASLHVFYFKPLQIP
jgi:hypothetical protein